MWVVLGILRKKWSIPHSQQESLKCRTWVRSQKQQNDLCSFPRQIIQYHSNPVQCPNHYVEAEVEWFYEDLHDLLELTHIHNKMSFSSQRTGMPK